MTAPQPAAPSTSIPTTATADASVGAVNLPRTAAALTTPWDPRLVARLNDCDIKLAFLDGAYVWHAHPHTDEGFYVLDGEVVIDLRGVPGGPELHDAGADTHTQALASSITLHTGDMYIVPRGVQHRPRSTGARVMLLERAGTLSTGDFAGVVPGHIQSHTGR